MWRCGSHSNELPPHSWWKICFTPLTKNMQQVPPEMTVSVKLNCVTSETVSFVLNTVTNWDHGFFTCKHKWFSGVDTTLLTPSSIKAICITSEIQFLPHSKHTADPLQRPIGLLVSCLGKKLLFWTYWQKVGPTSLSSQWWIFVLYQIRKL
jgi:hypothetical protein